MVTSETLQRAIEFAVKKHRGQKRKGDKRPYIMHPLSVMIRLYNIKDSENLFLLATAAVLHDTVEDCGVKLKTIARKFGHAVAALVEELTLDKAQYELIGKTEYLCQEVVKMSSYALCIKLCDRLDNVEDLNSMSVEFRSKYIKETRDIIDSLFAKRTKLTNTHIKLISLIQISLDSFIN